MAEKNTKEYIQEKKTLGLYGWDGFSAVHPGETLKDEIEISGLTQAEVAARAGCTVQTINRIVNGREAISMDMALRLERVFVGRPSAQFWINMQASYDKELAYAKEGKKAEEETGFFQTHLKETFKELQKLGAFENFVLKTKEDLKNGVLLLKNFFEASSLHDIDNKNVLGVAFRKYDREGINQYNLAALIKIGEKKARKKLQDPLIKDYDEKLFLEQLPEIKKLTREDPSVFLDKLSSMCLSLGVIVIYVPNMSHTHFGGATTWINGHPVIILKANKQWEDVFWFNFFHEVGHIIEHSKREFFVDFKDGVKTKTEQEADDFSQNILIPEFELITKKFKERKSLDSWLGESAQIADVPVSVIAGRVCTEVKKTGGNAWRDLGKYRPVINQKVTI